MTSIPFYAKRWISGVNMTDAVKVVQTLNQNKISASLDLLGENIKEEKQAAACTKEYLDLLNYIAQEKIDSHVSLKLTMLGLDINEDFCYANLCQILLAADKTNNRVALDMEGSAYTERTLKMYERAAAQFKSPEIVLQAYLHRTESDIERVLKANGRMRLCKGAYKEPASAAIQNMAEIVQNYKKLVAVLLSKGNRVCIATHDDEIIDFCSKYISENKIAKDKYEFQMLYGMREKTWHKLAQKDQNITIYVPYGRHWQAYYSRRLLERKENVFFVLKNLFRS